jgi:hypothetical protein
LKIKLLILICFSLTAATLTGQKVTELGCYKVNGNLTLDNCDTLMAISNGELISISEPAEPRQIGKVELAYPASAILLGNKQVFFGTYGKASLQIADLTDPAFPEITASLTLPGSAFVFDMARAGDILYLIMSGYCIYSVDISDTVHPVILDTLQTQCIFDITIRENLAYVSGYEKGLQIIDISDPTDLKVISSSGFDYYSVEVDGARAFLGSDSFGGIDIIDISDPFHPAQDGRIEADGEGQVWDLTCHNGFLYSATRNAGLLIYAVRNGQYSKVAGFCKPANGQCYAVNICDSLILLSSVHGGISLLRFDPGNIVSADPVAIAGPAPLYPNPARYSITAGFTLPSERLLQLTDLTGKVLKQLTCSGLKAEVSVEEFPPGLYLLRITGQDEAIVHRVMIIR